MKQKRLSVKPGAERSGFRPDSIVEFSVVIPDDFKNSVKASGEKKDFTLMDFLVYKLKDHKRTSIKELLKYGQVLCRGLVSTRFDTPLYEGDKVAVNFTRPFVTFSNPRLKIVYEDEDIIVVNKGYGLLSVGADKAKSHDKSAYSLLYDYVKGKDPKNKIFVVHRLDQHTSGLMMFAKNIGAKEAMQHNWNNMVIDRKYVAVTEGAPEPPEGKYESFLKENVQHVVYSVKEPDETAKHAVTYYKTLRTRGQYALVELSLATGRKNQIRVHLSENGHPIVGDRKYGAKTSPIHRLALHAQTLRFVHPVTRRDMNFTSPVPDSFNRLV